MEIIELNHRKVVIPSEARELREVSSMFEMESLLTCTKASTRRFLLTLGMAVVLLLTGVISGFTQSITPQVVSSGGGDTTNSNIGLSWTIGEAITETVTGSNSQITQGFHQNHFEIISVEDHRELGFDIVVYPNPSTDFIQISLRNIGVNQEPVDTDFKLILSDNKGTVLSEEIIKDKLEHTLSMQNYAVGQYYIKIIGTDDALHKSVKVIKLK